VTRNKLVRSFRQVEDGIAVYNEVTNRIAQQNISPFKLTPEIRETVKRFSSRARAEGASHPWDVIWFNLSNDERQGKDSVEYKELLENKAIERDKLKG
jgi:hypothetical protein